MDRINGPNLFWWYFWSPQKQMIDWAQLPKRDDFRYNLLYINIRPLINPKSQSHNQPQQSLFYFCWNDLYSYQPAGFVSRFSDFSSVVLCNRFYLINLCASDDIYNLSYSNWRKMILLHGNQNLWCIFCVIGSNIYWNALALRRWWC